MTHIIINLGALAIGFVAGLLVGRKNPKVADAAQAMAEKAKQ